MGIQGTDLVSQCRTARETEQLFSTMLWTAMPHLDAAGKRGYDLMANFGVSTIPALVFLDSTGAIMCQDGRNKMVRQQAASTKSDRTTTPVSRPQAGARVASGVRPQASPASGAVARKQTVSAPVQDCDLPAMAWGGLPPDTRTASQQAPRPPGPPPAFPTTTGASVRTACNRPAQQGAAGRPRGAATPNQEAAAKFPALTPRPPRRSDQKRPPPNVGGYIIA